MPAFLNQIWEFLFPRRPQVIMLEALTPLQLQNLLPNNTDDLGENIFALFSYQHKLTKEIVWEIKYKGNKKLAETVGILLYDAIVSELEEENAFEKFGTILLIPCPISDKRRFERGWNQAELLSQAVKACDHVSQFKHCPRQLVKIVHTESQSQTATRKERLNNLKNSLLLQNPESVTGRCVVLIDDVTTTGATFAEARRALKEAGAKKVICFALSH